MALAGVPLMSKTAGGLTPRPEHELAALMLAAYGDVGDVDRLTRGLRGAADALNRGDVALAMTSALHLRLPDLGEEPAARLAVVDDFLAKYDPNEPRDWRGRWTTGGAGSDGPGAKPETKPAARSRPASPTPRKTDRAPNAQTEAPVSHWDGISRPTGGHLYLTQADGEADDDYGRNEPPEPPPEGTIEPEPEPSLRVPRLPPGFDISQAGLTYPDGRFWPAATTEKVILILRAQKGGSGKPKMWLFVPTNGKGPILIGSTPKADYVLPPDYEEVELIGDPQPTKRNGEPTNHDVDTVNAALSYAITNRYSQLYFNSAITTSTTGAVRSALRPDLMGVVRPQLPLSYRFQPYESYSPGQKPADRQQQLQLHPDIAPVEGQHYKFLRLLWNKLVRAVGRRGRARLP